MEKEHKYSTFIKRAIELGALEARIINTSSIVTAAWVRMKCTFGCDGYNSSLCCPPNSPAPEETRKVLDGYKKAVLVHCEEETDVTGLIVKLEREVFLSGYYKAFGMGAGPCELCKKCGKEEECKHAELARPAMEACGIDVFATVRSNGFPIEVVKNFRCQGNYYGLVLIE